MHEPPQYHSDGVTVALTFKARDEAETELHAPMFEASVGHAKRLFIVDTGATESIFSRSLATTLNSTLGEDEPGMDHAGAGVSTWVATPDFVMRLGPRRLLFDPTLVIDAPPPFATWGIGGIVSPQSLDPDAVVVLDLAEMQLRLSTAPLRVIAEEIRARLRSMPLELRRHSETADAAKLVVVEGEVRNFGSVRVLFNTGGKEAECDPRIGGTCPVGAEQARGKGLSGTDVVGGVLDALQTVDLGGRAFEYRDVTLRPQGSSFDLQLGIEALRGTVVVVSPRHDDPVLWWPVQR